MAGFDRRILASRSSRTFRRAARATDAFENAFPRIDPDNLASEFNPNALSDDDFMTAFPDAISLEQAQFAYGITHFIQNRPESVSAEAKIIELFDEFREHLPVPMSLRIKLIALMDEDAVEQFGLQKVMRAHRILAPLPDAAFINEMLDKKQAVYELRQERLKLPENQELRENMENFDTLSISQKQEIIDDIIDFLTETHAEIFEIERYNIRISDEMSRGIAEDTYLGNAKLNGNITLGTSMLYFSFDHFVNGLDHEMDHLFQFKKIRELPNMSPEDPLYNYTMMMASNIQISSIWSLSRLPGDNTYYLSSPMERAAYLMNSPQSFGNLDWAGVGVPFSLIELEVPDFQERVPPSLLSPSP